MSQASDQTDGGNVANVRCLETKDALMGFVATFQESKQLDVFTDRQAEGNNGVLKATSGKLQSSATGQIFRRSFLLLLL